MVDRLSNGDITKHDKVFKQNYIHCLNVLSMWKDRDDYHAEMNKRMSKQRQ